MKNKNILVVDDDIDIREVIQYALNSEGYTIVTAGNGEEALDYLTSPAHSENPVNCIILDLMMPRMNGEEFIRTIKSSHRELAKIPIIVITAQGAGLNTDTLRDTKKIHKPMDLEDLYVAIEAVCPNGQT